MERISDNLAACELSACAGRARLGSNRVTASTDLSSGLTKRQREVIQMLARGMNDKQIAFELGISGATVKCHARGAVRQMEAKNRIHAVALFVRFESEMAEAY